MSERSETALVRDAASGDREALRLLSERYWPSIRRQAMLELGDRPLAEDAAQEALVRLIRFIHKVDPERPFVHWIRSVVRNCCRDVRIRVARRASRETPVVELGASSKIDRRLDLDRSARIAVSAFSCLSARQRQAFDLCDRQGYTIGEAATLMEIAPGTVRVLLHGARKRLRQELIAHRAELLDVLRDS